jgi:biopolymer transport protein ExbD
VRWLLVVVVLAGCFITPPMKFGSGKSSKEAQQQRRTEMTPPELMPVGQWTGTVRTAKIRVWADDDYRAQNVHWEKTFGDSLAYANLVLGPELGVRFEAEYKVWNHHTPGETMAEQLGDLGTQDLGDGVFAVVGLTSSLSLVSATFDTLGIANLPGKHMLLRGYADVFEREAFDLSFRDLPAEERESFYQARRRHKTTATFMHELGHNLGVAHEQIADTIMNPIYSDHSASLTTQARETMLATIDMRLHGRESRVPGVKAMAVDKPHATLVIALDASGTITAAGNELDDAGLDALFKKADHNTEVVVQTAKHVPRELITKVLDHARAAGLEHFSIAAATGP